MWIERDDGRLEAGRTDCVHDRPVAAVDPVEASDSYRARPHRELCRVVNDRHVSLARASSGAMKRSGSASATWKGPISVRRNAMQCPPSASAIARTYVPDETCSSRLATPSS